MGNNMENGNSNYNYGSAILSAFEYLLDNYPNVFIIGQGLWSPWYVGNSMTNLDKKYGIERIIDTPVSESACTGAAVGAALAGMMPIVVHPRMDFMLYAMDAIVNQAAKWSHMVGGQAHPSITIRAIINRGGEQGAQHSQALHAWFAHIPGLRVVMPATVADARDLMIASVLCPDPVLYVDDRWLYADEQNLPPIKELSLKDIRPQALTLGSDITIVSCGYCTSLSLKALENLKNKGISVELIDMRVINPFYPDIIVESVNKTGRLLVVDGGWKSCGISSEIICSVTERLDLKKFKSKPIRITLPDAPAPTSKFLEDLYYPSVEDIINAVSSQFDLPSVSSPS